jgi:hypothetical protein
MEVHHLPSVVKFVLRLHRVFSYELFRHQDTFFSNTKTHTSFPPNSALQKEVCYMQICPRNHSHYIRLQIPPIHIHDLDAFLLHSSHRSLSNHAHPRVGPLGHITTTYLHFWFEFCFKAFLDHRLPF